MTSKIFTYKISEKQTNYYYYIVSHIDNKDLVLKYFEVEISEYPDSPVNQFFDFCWDDISIDKSDVKPTDVINGTLPVDKLCMNTSDDYKMLLKQFLEEEEKPKVKAPPKKPRTPKEPKVKVEKAKKEPKPKPSKSVKIGVNGPSGPKIE